MDSLTQDPFLLSIEALGKGFGPFTQSLAKIQGSLLALSQDSDQRDLASQLSQVASASEVVYNHTTTKLEQLDAHAHEVSTQVSQMSELLKQVAGYLAMIGEIAHTTNLLALNTTIQATKAGEVGKSFLVISSEIRELSLKTQQSAQDIRGLLQNILEVSATIEDQAALTIESLETFNQDKIARSENLHSLVTLSQTLQQHVQNSALRNFIEVVKVDHLIWKSEVYKVILGISQKRESEFASHRACRLGKWYYEGQGHQLYRHYPAYQKLAAAHEAVHQSGFSTLKGFFENNAHTMQSGLVRMEEASLQVLDLLDELHRTVQ